MLAIFAFLALPLTAGFLVPFFPGRIWIKRAIWTFGASPWLAILGAYILVWRPMAVSLEPITLGMMLACWLVAGVVGVMVGKEAAAVWRTHKIHNETKRTSEIFR